jgi:hypothetical protein
MEFLPGVVIDEVKLPGVDPSEVTRKHKVPTAPGTVEPHRF